MALNIGIGNGWLEEYLIQKGWKIRSLDPIEGAVKMLRKGGIEADVANIEALPYRDGIFDVIFCSEVLEHLSNQQMEIGIKEVFRVLKIGGYFLGTVPYKENLHDNKVICPDCGKIFHRWGHQQDFDEIKLKKIFPDGLAMVLVKPKLFIDWQGLNIKRKVAAFIKLILFYLGSHGSNETLYFQIKKCGR
jgi:SAM-dependent methyltransferase